ncbi:MAG: hypothetical protein RLZZ306_17 [Bacteroidota bacterium]|jgi:hypothetical protein
MQNPKIWIPIIVFLTIGILYKNYSPNNDFDTFFDKFYIDQNLQLKSVKFPLKHIQADRKFTFTTKENWLELGDYNLIANSKGLQQEFIKKEYIASDSVHVVFSINIENPHPRVIYKFKKINNSWFLIETEDQSTGTTDLLKSK